MTNCIFLFHFCTAIAAPQVCHLEPRNGAQKKPILHHANDGKSSVAVGRRSVGSLGTFVNVGVMDG